MIRNKPALKNEVIGLSGKVEYHNEIHPLLEEEFPGCKIIPGYIDISIISDGSNVLLPPQGSQWKIIIIWVEGLDGEDVLDEDLRGTENIEGIFVCVLTKNDTLRKVVLCECLDHGDDEDDEHFGAWAKLTFRFDTNSDEVGSSALLAKYSLVPNSQSFELVH